MARGRPHRESRHAAPERTRSVLHRMRALPRRSRQPPRRVRATLASRRYAARVTHRVLLDVSSLMYRAYFAMGEAIKTPGGRPSGALHGYLDMVTSLLLSRRPDEVVHAYDHEWRPSARTDLYAGYKSQRQADPEGLPDQFTMLRQVLDLAGMPQAQTQGWEAEDAIGALCVQAAPNDRIEIVSGDRDLIQLVRDPAVKLLLTVRGVSELAELDEAGVVERMGVPANRYAEFAILRGDPSDSLPGVRGVGAKTAQALIELAEELAIRGPVQRLRAAMDAASRTRAAT